MPEPIIDPMTIIVASIGPSSRTSFGLGSRAHRGRISSGAVRLRGCSRDGRAQDLAAKASTSAMACWIASRRQLVRALSRARVRWLARLGRRPRGFPPRPGSRGSRDGGPGWPGPWPRSSRSRGLASVAMRVARRFLSRSGKTRGIGRRGGVGRSELAEEPGVVLVERADVLDPVPPHAEPLDPQAEGETAHLVGVVPHGRKTFGSTIPAPPISTQRSPPCQSISTSTLGSVNGKNDGRNRIFTSRPR